MQGEVSSPAEGTTMPGVGVNRCQWWRTQGVARGQEWGRRRVGHENGCRVTDNDGGGSGVREGEGGRGGLPGVDRW
jgi:hypothetical protein